MRRRERKRASSYQTKFSNKPLLLNVTCVLCFTTVVTSAWSVVRVVIEVVVLHA